MIMLYFNQINNGLLLMTTYAQFLPLTLKANYFIQQNTSSFCFFFRFTQSNVIFKKEIFIFKRKIKDLNRKTIFS